MSKFIYDGFQAWWKLNPKIFEHKKSANHINNLEKWKTLKIRLTLNKTINNVYQQSIAKEKRKWREILYRILDIILFLAKQNLAFRGHRESLVPKTKEIF